jgi:hypothetical protein
MDKADLVFKRLSQLYEFNRGLQAFKASARVRTKPPERDRQSEKLELDSFIDTNDQTEEHQDCE